MRFVIRADAYTQSGAGHVMRSAVIAEELIFHGFDVVFIGDTSEIPWVRDYVSTMGFSEILDTKDSFDSNPNLDILILDSYTIPANDPKISSNSWFKIVAFVDDTTPAYLANIYINAGLDTNWKPPKGASSSEFMSGIEFVQIRSSLKLVLSKESKGIESNPKLLVIGGGSDPFGFVKEMSEILRHVPLEFNATFVVSENHKERDAQNFNYIPFGFHVEDLLNDIDLVFTTAGTSSWEFLYLQKRVGIACAASNQESNYKFQTLNKMAIGIGGIDPENKWFLNQEVIFETILNSKSLKLNETHVDGLGGQRVFKAIMNLVGKIN